MPGADCESDHNPVIITIKIRLQRVKKSSKTVKWNINNLRKPDIRDAYRMQLDKKLQEEKIDRGMETDEIWTKLKYDICGGDLRERAATKETELDELRDIAVDGGKKKLQKQE